MSKLGKTKEVNVALSGEPQNKSLKYCSNSQECIRRVILARSAMDANPSRQKVPIRIKARQLVRGPTTLPVPSTPVPSKEVPKSVAGITPPSSSQPCVWTKPISSTLSTGADPKKNSVDVVAKGSLAFVSPVGISKSRSPHRLHGHEGGPEKDKGKEKRESSSSMSASIKRTRYKESVYAYDEVALHGIRQMTDKLELLRDHQGCRKFSTSNAQVSGPTSALLGNVGEDSFELYKRCLLERVQAILTKASLIQLEEEMAHCTMQSLAFNRQLTLRAIFWMEKEARSSAKIKQVQADLKKAEDALTLATFQMEEVLAKHKEEITFKDRELAVLTKENHKLRSSLRSNQANLANMQAEFEKEKKRQLQIGEGKVLQDFLQTKEFEFMLNKVCQDAVNNLTTSPEFDALSKAFDRILAALNMCKAQLQKLVPCREGFNRSQLGVVKTENLEDYHDVPLPHVAVGKTDLAWDDDE